MDLFRQIQLQNQHRMDQVSSVWVIGSTAQITHPAGVAHIERH